MAKQQVRKKKAQPAPAPEATSVHEPAVAAATEAVAPVVAADVAPRARRGRTNGKTSPAVAEAPVAAGAPTFDEIARRAYFRYVERGGILGDELADWLAAEEELKASR